MPNHPAPAWILRNGDREELESWARSASIRSGVVMRARIVLLAAGGGAILIGSADQIGTT